MYRKIQCTLKDKIDNPLVTVHLQSYHKKQGRDTLSDMDITQYRDARNTCIGKNQCTFTDTIDTLPVNMYLQSYKKNRVAILYRSRTLRNTGMPEIQIQCTFTESTDIPPENAFTGLKKKQILLP